jgi:NADH-quinone oxidoreductase subunit F
VGAAYICGNNTIESLEGKRGNPVSNHHFLQFQVYGPVVNNVRNIASVPWIVNNSGDDYARNWKIYWN